MTNELQSYIKTYFGLTRHEDIEAVGALYKLETLKKGDVYSEEGRICHKLSFVKSGVLRMYALREGKEVTQWISTQGQFVTELSSFVFETPGRWSIEALTDVELFTITRERYQTIAQHMPHWLELERLFLVKCFTSLEDRVFSHLSMSAEERYQAFFQDNRELFQTVPLQYIASMLGMAPETFSRVRKKSLL